MASAPDMEGTPEAMEWRYDTPPQPSNQLISAPFQHVAFDSPLPGSSPTLGTPEYAWNQVLQNPETPPKAGTVMVSAASPGIFNGIYTSNYSPFTDSSLGSLTPTPIVPGANPAIFNATIKVPKGFGTCTSTYSPLPHSSLDPVTPTRVMPGAFNDTIMLSPPSATKRTFNEYAEGELVETQRGCEPDTLNNMHDGATRHIGKLRRVERSWREVGTINVILVPVLFCVAVVCNIITFGRIAVRAGQLAGHHTRHAIAQRGGVMTSRPGARLTTTYIAAVEAANRAKRVMITCYNRQALRRNHMLPATPVRTPPQIAYNRSVRWADETFNRPGQLTMLHTYSPVIEIVGYDVPILDVDLNPLGKQCQQVNNRIRSEDNRLSNVPGSTSSPEDTMDMCEEESSSASPQPTQLHSEVAPLADIHPNTVAQTLSSTNTQTQDAVHHPASDIVGNPSSSNSVVPDGSSNKAVSSPVSEAIAHALPVKPELPTITPTKVARFYESPKTGLPVSTFKKFTKGETMDHVVTPSMVEGSIDNSDISSTIDPSILPYDSSMLSLEEVAYVSRVSPPKEIPTSQPPKLAFSVTAEGSPVYSRTGTRRFSCTKSNGEFHEPALSNVALDSATKAYAAHSKTPVHSRPLGHPGQAISEQSNSGTLQKADSTSSELISPQNHEVPHQLSPRDPDQVDIVQLTETDNEHANSQLSGTSHSLHNEIPIQLSPNGIPDQVEVVHLTTENSATENAISSDKVDLHNRSVPSQLSPSAIPNQVEVVTSACENDIAENAISYSTVPHRHMNQPVQASFEEPTMNGNISSNTNIAPKPLTSHRVRRKSSPATPAKITAGLERLEVSPELDVSLRRSTRRTRARELEEARLREEAQARAAAEQARRELEEAQERARKEKEDEAERQKQGVRRVPAEKIIVPLSVEWEQKVAEAMQKSDGVELATTTAGVKLTRKDFGTVLPVPGRDRASGWLNDEMVLGYLQAVVEFGLEKTGHVRGRIPKYYAFNTFFYTNLRNKGADSIRRWATKAKIGGKNLESVERVFIPVHESSHWTLLVVSPIARTIEYFDSLGGSSATYVRNVKAWLKQEMGTAYKDEEWRVLDTESPMQDNGKDCGVFAITTAKMVVLGWDPKGSYGAEDMTMQRKRICAELMGGGFRGEFEPRMAF